MRKIIRDFLVNDPQSHFDFCHERLCFLVLEYHKKWNYTVGHLRFIHIATQIVSLFICLKIFTYIDIQQCVNSLLIAGYFGWSMPLANIAAINVHI